MASNAAHATDAGCNKCKKCEKSEKYEKCDNFVTSVKSVKSMKSMKSVTILEICGIRRQRYVYISYIYARVVFSISGIVSLTPSNKLVCVTHGYLKDQLGVGPRCVCTVPCKFFF